MTKQEAIKLIDDRMCFGRGKWSKHHMPEIDDYWKAGQMAIKALKRPEQKTGKWIDVDDAYNRIRGRCSLCGWEAHMYEDDVVGMDYCPNCGADMRGEDNDTN